MDIDARTIRILAVLERHPDLMILLPERFEISGRNDEIDFTQNAGSDTAEYGI